MEMTVNWQQQMTMVSTSFLKLFGCLLKYEAETGSLKRQNETQKRGSWGSKTASTAIKVAQQTRRGTNHALTPSRLSHTVLSSPKPKPCTAALRLPQCDWQRERSVLAAPFLSKNLPNKPAVCLGVSWQSSVQQSPEHAFWTLISVTMILN